MLWNEKKELLLEVEFIYYLLSLFSLRLYEIYWHEKLYLSPNNLGSYRESTLSFILIIIILVYCFNILKCLEDQIKSIKIKCKPN